MYKTDDSVVEEPHLVGLVVVVLHSAAAALRIERSEAQLAKALSTRSTDIAAHAATLCINVQSVGIYTKYTENTHFKQGLHEDISTNSCAGPLQCY
jgi:archaellum component FlaG (FlaF/FlaG flagellin family)